MSNTQQNTQQQAQNIQNPTSNLNLREDYQKYNSDLPVVSIQEVELIKGKDKDDKSEGSSSTNLNMETVATFINEDDKYLAKLGYSSELHRGFNAFMSFTFCFTSVGVICSNSLVFDYGINTGGPVMLTFGWIVGSFFTLLIALNLAEITSTYPVSGSVYHWAGILSPKKYAPIISYICGWFSFLGNAACDASFAYGFSDMLAATLQLGTNGEISLDNKQKVGVAIACLFTWVIKNMAKVDAQGWFNNISAIYQLVSTLVIIIAIVAIAPERSTSEFVWLEYNNTTGIDSKLYVCLIGTLTTLYGMSGYEAGSQASEETTNAQVSAPKGIVNGVIAGIVVGLAFFLGLLYSINNNIDAVINGMTDQPVINVFDIAFRDSNGNQILAGSLTMSILLLVSVYLGGFSHLTVTTRIVFAMTRDGALPFSKYVYGVTGKFKIPVRSIIYCCIFECFICLLPLINDATFSAMTSISTIGYQFSYLVPILLRITVARNTFQQGPYNLGRYSFVIGWLSCVWLFITNIFFFFPTYFDENMEQDAENFNYTCVVFGATLFIAAVYWYFPIYGARHHFKGPKRPDEEEEVEQSHSDNKEIKLGEMHHHNHQQQQYVANPTEQPVLQSDGILPSEFEENEVQPDIELFSSRPTNRPLKLNDVKLKFSEE